MLDEQQEVSLRCECVLCSPVLTPVWEKEGRPLMPDGEHIQTENFGKTLVVKNVKGGVDDGRYSCIFRRSSSLNRNFDVKIECKAFPAFFWLPQSPHCFPKPVRSDNLLGMDFCGASKVSS